MLIQKEFLGKLGEKDIFLFTLVNKNKNYVQLTNYGASVVSIVVPDKNGMKENVVLGFSNLEGYLKDKCYIGATVGRFANRIANAGFKIDNERYFLEANENNNSNHSGASGFHKRIFDYEIKNDSVSFSLLSKDGEGGFPGNLQLAVAYTWNDENELLIEYNATTDKKTIVNLTNHSYFNLSVGRENILSHELNIASGKIVETDEHYIPTGKIVDAGNKKFHHNSIKEKLIITDDKAIGLNDCYVIQPNSEAPVCEVLEKVSGRTMSVFTSYPGLLLYTGDFLESSVDGYFGRKYQPFDGFCLECQYYPDSPNHANFPSTILDVNEEYNEFIKFSFGVK
ncbi:galactose mutarotase [Arachidicoccus ginsenosidimutans]|uniref:aldose epimerase family protein n=1 Tax=Arachidicoccus sp. BS20 TaxID=1850526 RepID=UPI0007F07E9D|nr:aldose epimerase family protein [Arachidicoccus sp. BS20]ANI88813.1 galactose mutarotase [Arachidicoccus sp. BS20]